MSRRFNNRVVIVTGAGSGIGRATALHFAREGAKVAVVDRRLAAAESTRAEIVAAGGTAVAVEADVTSESACAAAVAQSERDLGAIDVLVNNAGIGHSGTALQTDEKTWDALMAVNVKGQFLMAKAVLPGMIARGKGSIVNTASIAGIKAVPDRTAYTASKFAVVGLTRAMALDHVAQGIRVNCICPGTTDTPWIAERLAQTEDPEKTRAAMVARQPMGRMGTPEEMAAAILFLAADESSFTTGTALVIDGGFSA